MERQGANLQTRTEELQLINQALRDNYKLKEDDALAYLSDQLLVLSKRIYTTVRKKAKLYNNMGYLLFNLYFRFELISIIIILK